MLKPPQVVDVVVADDAVFFAVVVATNGRDVPGVSLKGAAAFVTGAAEVSKDGDVRVVRFDAEAERGDVDGVVSVVATVGGVATTLNGPAVPKKR